MAANIEIRFIPYGKMDTILPLAFELNNGKISLDLLGKRLKAMLAMGGYQCIGAYDAEELVGICGIWELNKLYVGKHLEPDNVFVKKAYRSSGVGQMMLDFLLAYAKDINCDGTEVNCYVSNLKGQKFWERQGYQPLAYHYFMNFESTGNE